jgi:hypothetical protein
MALTVSLDCYTEEISDYGAERLVEIFHRGARLQSVVTVSGDPRC